MIICMRESSHAPYSLIGMQATDFILGTKVYQLQCIDEVSPLLLALSE